MAWASTSRSLSIGSFEANLLICQELYLRTVSKLSSAVADGSVFDLDPVTIRVLKVHLPNTIGSDRNLPQCARKVLKCGPTIGQLLNDLIEARRRKGKVGGPRSARQKLRRPKDQMDGTTRAKSEPADIRACGLFLDLRKPEDLRVEPGARVQVAHEQREVVQFQGGRHSCTSKACYGSASKGAGLRPTHQPLCALWQTA